MREFAAGHGCGVREIPQGSIVRLRFPYERGRRNPLTEVLRRYGVWGQRCDVKCLPDVRFSRDFWLGCLSGLIDTDGCVRERVNTRGTVHGSLEFATVSPRLAAQVSNALLCLGVANRTRVVMRKGGGGRLLNGYPIVSQRPLNIVEVSRATAPVRLAGLLDLRIDYKACRLQRISCSVGHVAPARSEMHGYDEAVALDRVKSIVPGGIKPVYGFVARPSGLCMVNGLVTGSL
ncbi:LAGLIDADG family homing endonuclease [Streptomyces sp. NPDC093250]|uniref:LAGLIDADG family homing endonuclease n=1 Tax=Streptomyces sp. NPDC093250 TaxID=3366036 RepID=UPI003801CB08